MEEGTLKFPIVIHKDEGSCYGVTVPDLPGCFSAGETFEEAMESAREAILLHVEGLLMDGLKVPAQQSIESHLGNANHADGLFALVTVDLSKLTSKAKRINITVPSRVLAIIDEAASREGETRSGLIARAALSYVNSQGELESPPAARTA